jgi:hypothetical protein
MSCRRSGSSGAALPITYATARANQRATSAAKNATVSKNASPNHV